MTTSGQHWVRVYYFALDQPKIGALQAASLHRDRDIGLHPRPLVAGDGWWREIATGRRPTHVVEGTIAEVCWASMADFPKFTIDSPSEPRKARHRDGDLRRYAEGLAVQVSYVEHDWKHGLLGRRLDRFGLGSSTRIVLQVLIENSTRRSSAIAPGPVGAGFEPVRQEGDVTHFLRFASQEDASRAAGQIDSPRIFHDPFLAQWNVQTWCRDPSLAGAQRDHLAGLARRCGGAYDGGEVIGGELFDADP